MGMSAHQSAKSKSVEYMTPPEILKPLGRFDLDPCTPVNRPWDTADKHYTILDDGLIQPWTGRVWLNPPFGREAIHWMRRLAKHGDGIALLPARTETKMFFECVWGIADCVLFIKNRPHFHFPNGKRLISNSGAPIALIAYGSTNALILKNSGLGACVIELRAR